MPSAGVVLVVHPHDLQELVLGLVVRAVDVGVVLGEAPRPHRAQQLAAALEAVDRAVLGELVRQLAVAVRPCRYTMWWCGQFIGLR